MVVLPGRVAELSPPEFLQLTGHPLRWRLLSELACSDRTVHELTGLVGEAQNLVSYHLAKLRAGALVSTRRSTADGRDAYYAVDLSRVDELLSATAGALHPGLGMQTAASDRPACREASVLFLCTGNSARSQMAEALTDLRSAGAVVAWSAGSSPKPLHPHAVRVMSDEYGVDLRDHESKHVRLFVDQRFDRVVTLCDRVREVCPDFPGIVEPVHWSIPDPTAGCSGGEAGRRVFRRVAAELDTRIGFLLATLESTVH